MEPDSEETSLVSPKRIKPLTKLKSQVKSTSTDARDYDSLNNLMFSGSDTDSILNEDKIDRDASRKDETNASGVSNSSSIVNQCCNIEGTYNGINSKLLFKEELDKHRLIVRKDIKEGTRHTENNYKLSSKKSIWQSFISLCIGLFFAFMSFMPLRNIQTSLYPLKHLGNVSLACMYFCFAIGCLFSSWITQNARPKGIILIALFGHVVYCAANVYPSIYFLLPASCFFGFFHAPLWAAQELMLASYGASYTAITNINIDKAIHQFQGVFLIFCHAAQVFGNLIESVILQCGDDGTSPVNVTLYQQKFEDELLRRPIEVVNISEDPTRDLIWIGPFGYRIHPGTGVDGLNEANYENVVKFVFISFAVVGMTIVCLFLNKPDIIIHKKKSSLPDRLKEVVRFLPTGTFLSLSLLMLFSGMQQAVVIGNVTKIYGSLTLGISKVGYMMMCYGTCQLATLLLVEKLHNKPRPSVVIFNAFIISLGLLVWLYIWEPNTDNVFKVMGYVGLWGVVDGLWQSQVQTTLLAWSVGRKEAAVTVFRTVQSLGLVLVFLLDIWFSLLTLICICSAILVLGVIFYLVLEVIRTPLTSSQEPSPFAL